MGRRCASFALLVLVACNNHAHGTATRHMGPLGLRPPVVVTAAEVRTGTAVAPLSKGRAGEHKLATHHK
jgi:hypothetical protein